MKVSDALKSVFRPFGLGRDQAMVVSERIVSVATTISSLEYLVQHRHMDSGGLNDWDSIKKSREIDNRVLRSVVSRLSGKQVSLSLHAGRLAASAGLLVLPSSWSTVRGVLNLYNSVSYALLTPRHRFGTDGSDQVGTLVQTFNGLARLSASPRSKDTFLWGLALQTGMAYGLSGWVKMAGPMWREGSALSGIMRTKTYGSEPFFRWTQRSPRLARAVTQAALAFEALFPLVLLTRGRLTKSFLLTGVGFHAVNAVLMGLGRFLLAFPAMYPALAYVTIPKDHPIGQERDDSVLPLLGLGAVAVGVYAWLVKTNRRKIVMEGWPHTLSMTTRRGNVYRYEWGGPRADASEPVYLFTPAMAATAEYFAWITESLAYNHGKRVVMASRPGYAASLRHAKDEFTLDEALDDLEDLVAETVAPEQKVVLLGHSLGGELVRRLALRLGPSKVQAVVYLDPTHPAELSRSDQQREGAEKMTDSLEQMVRYLKWGTGFLMKRPQWIDSFPHNYRERHMAHYADSRLWEAALREWNAVYEELLAFTGPLEVPDVPALLIAADDTLNSFPEQGALYEELVPGSEIEARQDRQYRILAHANHDSMLSDSKVAEKVVGHLTAFMREQEMTEAVVS
ncbi:alpha/beta fold hydrolase [Microbacterium sp. A93]|uniref:alpha/beta fold hydrolase n=1 Tax=Microbacterium sp. A93 TaxID=3450716 RepID=UPI003F42EA8D